MCIESENVPDQSGTFRVTFMVCINGSHHYLDGIPQWMDLSQIWTEDGWIIQFR